MRFVPNGASCGCCAPPGPTDSCCSGAGDPLPTLYVSSTYFGTNEVMSTTFSGIPGVRNWSRAKTFTINGAIVVPSGLGPQCFAAAAITNSMRYVLRCGPDGVTLDLEARLCRCIGQIDTRFLDEGFFNQGCIGSVFNDYYALIYRSDETRAFNCADSVINLSFTMRLQPMAGGVLLNNPYPNPTFTATVTN
jgi:hypothetical protein